MRNYLFLLIVLFPFCIEAQQKDTLTVMSYNLLFYRQTTSFCTNSNNNPATKDAAMRTIIDHTLPDILVVNEMGGGSSLYSFQLALNALNKNGRSYYNTSNPMGIGQSLINVLYYDNRKLVLEKQETITKDLQNNNLVRLIDLFTLRYKDTNLAVHKDTTRINIIVAHLKAGSSTADQNERADATEAIMAHLDSNNAIGNYLFAGDLNVYRSTEAAYQDLTAYIDTSLRFHDPINLPGNWTNNGFYSSIHTQSTQTSGGCSARGGMDDRFDFILASDEVMNNTDKIKYINNSYQALGQDGNRFNGSILSPTNNSVPMAVSQALSDMSDHLPVLMDLELSLPVVTSLNKVDHLMDNISFSNPSRDQIQIQLGRAKSEVRRIEIYDLSSKLLIAESVINGELINLDISKLKKGTYFIRFIDRNYQQKVEKLIKI